MALLPTGRNDQYKLLAAIAFLAAAGLYFNFVWSPKATELATLQSHVDTLQTMNDRAKRDVARGSIDKLRAQANEYTQEVDIMRQLVPTGNEVPALLASVSNAARQANLDVSAFTPDGKTEGDQFDTYKFKLSVTGPYHKIGEFLANVASLRRIVAPINLQLAVSSQADKNRDPRTRWLDATFDIQTYVARTALDAAPAPKKEGK
jgi:type IV pilus assembly protein PilO